MDETRKIMFIEKNGTETVFTEQLKVKSFIFNKDNPAIPKKEIKIPYHPNANLSFVLYKSKTKLNSSIGFDNEKGIWFHGRRGIHAVTFFSINIIFLVSSINNFLRP